MTFTLYKIYKNLNDVAQRLKFNKDALKKELAIA
jgi:hypothetical protein